MFIDERDTIAVGQLMLQLIKTGQWWKVGYGKTRQDEPLWGCIIQEPEIDGGNLAEAEGHSLPTCIERALAEYAAHVERMDRLNAKKDETEGIAPTPG